MTSVQQVELFDVSGVRDNGVKALLILAKSLRWVVHMKPGNPANIIAHDGTMRRIPTNTTIKSGVFQGHLSAIMSHSTEFTPTIELIDHVIAVVKPNQDQERRMRLAIGETPQQHRERMSAHDAGAWRSDRNGEVTQHIELTDEQLLALELQQAAEEAAETAAVVAEPTLPEGNEERHVVSERPARALTSNGWSYSSGIGIERTWSDGVIDFLCNGPGCDYTHEKLTGISGHWRVHIRRGEVLATNTQANKEARLDLQPPGAVPNPAQPSFRIRGSSDKLRAIREILGVDDSGEIARLRHENERLRTQLAQLKLEYAEVEAEWEALQDLIVRKKK